ncbi:MAG: hypothetical protein ACFFAS_20475 [Promethearchaeota archaeon]
MTKIEIDIPDDLYEKASQTYKIFDSNIIKTLEKVSVNYLKDTLKEIEITL